LLLFVGQSYAGGAVHGTVSFLQQQQQQQGSMAVAVFAQLHKEQSAIVTKPLPQAQSCTKLTQNSADHQQHV
jgi:hypothetical protein